MKQNLKYILVGFLISILVFTTIFIMFFLDDKTPQNETPNDDPNENQQIDQTKPNNGTPGLIFSFNEDSSACAVIGYEGTEKDIIIPEYYNECKVVSISKYAFYKCAVITSVKIPNSVSIISFHAFQECINLEKVEMEDNDILAICGSAFEGCTNLKNVKLSSGIQSIPDRCFYDCKNLTQIEFPPNITYIGDEAFYGTSFTAIEIPEGIKNIRSKAFYNTGLSRIVLPSTLESFTEFCDSPALREVTIKGNTISKSAFSSNEQLETLRVNILGDIKEIPELAFESISELHYHGTIKEFKEINIHKTAFGINRYDNIVMVYCSDGIMRYWVFDDGISNSEVLS